MITVSIYLCIFVFLGFLARVVCFSWPSGECWVYCVERLRNPKMFLWNSIRSHCSVVFWNVYMEIRLWNISLRHNFGIFIFRYCNIYVDVWLGYLCWDVTLGYSTNVWRVWLWDIYTEVWLWNIYLEAWISDIIKYRFFICVKFIVINLKYWHTLCM
jgi:hypothetical protein